MQSIPIPVVVPDDGGVPPRRTDIPSHAVQWDGANDHVVAKLIGTAVERDGDVLLVPMPSYRGYPGCTVRVLVGNWITRWDDQATGPGAHCVSLRAP